MVSSFPPVCLTIGPSDCSGGSGIQADIKTFLSLNCYGASAVSAIAVQTLHRIQALHPIPAEVLRAQLDAVASSLPVQVVKVGMLMDVASVRVVAAWLREHPKLPTVVDPVAADGAGVSLTPPKVLHAICEELLPRAVVATPNRAEAALLAGMDEVLDADDMLAAAQCIFQRHGCAVVVTGGMRGNESLDVLVGMDGSSHLCAPAHRRSKVHGVGAVHGAAIAAGLAKGDNLREAVLAAKLYCAHAIAAAPSLANGEAVLWQGVGEQVIAGPSPVR
jgi:hydroxymethylpyrimidine/phosphomethylpyrimidine kinase